MERSNTGYAVPRQTLPATRRYRVIHTSNSGEVVGDAVRLHWWVRDALDGATTASSRQPVIQRVIQQEARVRLTRYLSKTRTLEGDHCVTVQSTGTLMWRAAGIEAVVC